MDPPIKVDVGARSPGRPRDTGDGRPYKITQCLIGISLNKKTGSPHLFFYIISAMEFNENCEFYGAVIPSAYCFHRFTIYLIDFSYYSHIPAL